MPKRDMDLVRDLLLKIESIADPASGSPIAVAGRPQIDVDYHLTIIRDSGLITWECKNKGSAETWYFQIRLTWEGHEFLDNARSETVWKDAKKALSDGALKTAAFAIWSTILSQIVAKNIGLD